MCVLVAKALVNRQDVAPSGRLHVTVLRQTKLDLATSIFTATGSGKRTAKLVSLCCPASTDPYTYPAIASMSRYRQCVQRLIARQATRAANKQPCQLDDAVSASVRSICGSAFSDAAAGERISGWLPPPQSNSDVRGSRPFQQTKLFSTAASLSRLSSPVSATISLAVRPLIDCQHRRAHSTSTIDQPEAGVNAAHPQHAAKAGRSVIAEANDVLQVTRHVQCVVWHPATAV